MTELAKRLAVVASISSVSLLIVVTSLFITNPTSAGPYGVTAWFVLLFVGLCGAIALALYAFKTTLAVGTTDNWRFFGSLRQGALISGWATLTLAMSSLRQLGLRDSLLTLALVILIELYFSLKA